MNYQQLIITEPAANFRALARQGLGGRWSDAIVKGIIYMLIASVPVIIILAMTGFFQSYMQAYTDYAAGKISVVDYYSKSSSFTSFNNIVQLLLMGALTFGISSIFLRFRRSQEAPHALLFSGFSRYGKCFLLYLLITIFTALWTLLFIIPGIIAFYRYRLAWYILIDNPEVGVLEAITISKNLMRGNKWKLFCMDLSFIGWAILTAIAMSIVSGIISAVIAAGSYSQIMSTADISTIYSGGNLAALLVGVMIGIVFCAPVLMYHGTAEASFYERASGLLRYTDEVSHPLHTNTPPAPPQA